MVGRGRGRWTVVAALVMGALPAPSGGALAQGTVMRPAGEPAAPAPSDPVTRSSYFFVGGRYQKVGEKTLMVGQMFVQVRTPAKVTQPYPVVMVHGLAQTGVNFLSTPDGRSGWAQRFVEWGYQVYVVDQVGRGRSGTNPEVYGPYDRLGTRDLERTYTAPEVYDLYPQAKLHTQWPAGPGVQGNPSFDQYFASQVPYLANSQQTEELVDTALSALLDRTGPAILLTHGQGALFGWALSDSRPDLVKAHLAVEPSGPPFFDVKFRGGKDFWEKSGDGRARAYGLTRMPLTFAPAVKGPEDLVVAQQAKPAGDTQVRCWLQGDPVHTLPNLARVPTVVVTAEASFHAAYDDCTVAFLTQAEHLRREGARQRPHGDAGEEQRPRRRHPDGLALRPPQAVGGSRRPRPAGGHTPQTPLARRRPWPRPADRPSGGRKTADAGVIDWPQPRATAFPPRPSPCGHASGTVPKCRKCNWYNSLS